MQTGFATPTTTAPIGATPIRPTLTATDLGDVCDIAPGTPGEGEPDGIALVGGAPTEFVMLEWNDEQVVVLIPQPGTYETFTLVVESPGDADFGGYWLTVAAASRQNFPPDLRWLRKSNTSSAPS